jgi:hypothetical protein
VRHRLTMPIAMIVTCAASLFFAAPAGAGPVPNADGLIAKEGRPSKGDDIYNTSGNNQTVKQKIRRGRTREFRWVVENDGDAGDVTLDGPSSNNCFKVTFNDALDDDVTDEVAAGAYIATLDPAQRERLKVRVKARRCGNGTKRTLKFDVEPNIEDGFDRVRAKVKLVVPPPPPPPPPPCHPSYPTVCIPPPPPDLDCTQIPHRNFPVVGNDPHGFDGDNDGVGCET